MAELPSGTVTFLFTDLEDSTRLWEEVPDAMQPALARHDEILRGEVAANGGHIVKTTGDGVHAVFATAHDALDAAVAAQRALERSEWGDTGRLRVRMGLHTCEAELRDGDYYGSAVNRAARLMSAAHGGQIVVSHATEEIARDGLGEGVELVDLGEHNLRDLARAERVFQVRAPGLGDDFPTLRSLDAFPGNLPVQLTSFVGRDHELTAVAMALDEWRLVTLTGVGGVGKTRLSVQAAAAILPRFPDGAWLCELAAASDADTMLQVVAATLGVQARQGVSLRESIVDALRPKRQLLVLDNCEHQLRAVAGLAAEILRACPDVRLLATSREGLGVAGEQIWPLASLTLAESSELDRVGACDAVRLFVDRAHAARPGFVLSETNAGAVGEICTRLDGIPLAIELAAARVAALSPGDIRGLLGERFRLLTGGRHTTVERHQTLLAAVDWSYSLLDDRERVVFDRLSVFSGSFDARAAQAVVSGDGIEAWDVLDALTGLVAKSMVNAEEDLEGVMRYQLLETLRQYGREHLDATGAADAWRRRHARHYVVVVDEATAGLHSPDELVWRRRMASDLDNVRAALTWSLDRDDQADAEYGIEIIATFSRVLYAMRNSVVADFAERAAARADASPPERRVEVYAAAAVATGLIRGDREAAREYAFAALRENVQSSYGTTAAYAALSFTELQAGRKDAAYQWAIEAARVLESLNAEDWERAHQRSTEAVWAAVAGEGAIARAAADEGLILARRVNSPSTLVLALWGTGIAYEADDAETALAAFEECVPLVRAGADDVNFGGILARIARLRDHAGDHRGALDALDEALEHFHRAGPRTELVVVIAQLSRTLSRLGNAEPAGTLAGTVAGPFAPLAAVNSDDRLARATTKARETLGDTGYDTAYARGESMSYTDATAYARAEVKRAIAEHPEDTT